MRIGQFCLPDANDDLAQLFSSRLCYLLPFQFATNITVSRVQLWHSTQPVSDISYEIAVFPVVLKTTVAIAVAAVVARKRYQLARTDFHSLDCLYQVFHFCAVGSNILYGTGTDFSRNERQVLSTIQVVGYAPVNDVVPNLTATTAHQCSLLLRNATQGRVHYRSVKISCKQQITAAAQQQVGLFQRVSHPDGLIQRFKFQEPLAGSVDTKGIMS